MTLKTILALDALEALLTSIDGLPTCRRNDQRLDVFDNGLLLAMADGDIVNAAIELGSAPVYELEQQAAVIFAVQGEPGAARDAIVAGGLEKIAAALFPGGLPWTVADLVEDTNLAGDVERDHLKGGSDATAPPIETYRFNVALTLQAPTPFG